MLTPARHLFNTGKQMRTEADEIGNICDLCDHSDITIPIHSRDGSTVWACRACVETLFQEHEFVVVRAKYRARQKAKQTAEG